MQQFKKGAILQISWAQHHLQWSKTWNVNLNAFVSFIGGWIAWKKS